MKLGRNQLCPWGSGLKFKKCCLTKRPLVTAPSVLNHPGLTVPAIVVDDVLNGIFSSPDDLLRQRIETLANSQHDLCQFILSSSLPPSASFPAGLNGFAIIWMFEQHRQPRALPEMGVASIQRCFGRNARSFLDFDNPHSIMSGRFQPYIHKFIADSLFDFDEGKLHGYDLFTLFLLLKTTVDVLHDAISNIAGADSQFATVAAPNTPVSDRNLNFAFLHTWLYKQHVITSFEPLFLRRKVASLMVPNTKGPETRTDG